MIKNKVIIDADCGIDDALALIFAIKSDIDIIGITSVSGNVNSLESAKNIKAILNLLGKDIPVYTSGIPNLDGEYIDAKDTHGEDGLGETHYGKGFDYCSDVQAEDFILESLKKYDNIDIIALGPLTNLARAYLKDKDIFNKCNSIISMGGTYKAFGNMSPVTEFNYYHDPKAVELILESEVPMTMVTLDVTRKIFLTPHVTLNFKDKNKVGNFIYEVTKFYMDFHRKVENFDGCIINDILNIAYYLDNNCCNGITAPVKVVTEGVTRGQLLVDSWNMFYPESKECLILNEVNAEKVMDMFLSTLELK
ncbi:nucleoside hydrolase [Oceanirhabdus sp. W0125-5]|uniref:nucleoside hydrolase n=1 Tax=Oceanirhabdus sp. W0125-5 TaxID=2999116 RepID=UPI0022F334B0|nr:nucleoside hydrolase [Oceanirhabdus sp. W0125-5]WBW99578.1 nucleoside hydrolase [Oceanirhabdus sp. W0125-5]